MNDGLNRVQNNTPCEKCGQKPCVCNDKNQSAEIPKQKSRVKGSHRTGNPPNLKWL